MAATVRRGPTAGEEGAGAHLAAPLGAGGGSTFWDDNARGLHFYRRQADELAVAAFERAYGLDPDSPEGRLAAEELERWRHRWPSARVSADSPAARAQVAGAPAVRDDRG